MGGALMKGHSHNNGGRGKSYGLLFLVAFGIAIFGIILVHNLRERRMVNLIVKEKDHQLISLQLLLQKEREYVKEAKFKMDTMKAKMRALRNHKMDMDSRLLEMQSTISSLKDDQRAIEIALEEKRNEMEQLRERSEESNSESSHAKILSEMLRRKEAEIEELKRNRDLPLKALSLRSDDSSVNGTSNATEDVEELRSAAGLKTETEVDPDDMKGASANNKDEQVLALVADGKTREQIINGSDSNMTREEGRTQRGEGVKEKSSSNGEMDGMGGEKKTEFRSTETAENVEEDSINSKSRSEEDDHHRHEMQYVGGKKREMPKNLHGGGYTFRGKHGNIRRLKGNRLTLTANGEEVRINSTMDTSTVTEGLKMKITGQGQPEDGKGDANIRDSKADDDENRGDSPADDDDDENREETPPDTTNLPHSMTEHAEDIIPKSGKVDKHENAITSNGTNEQSQRDILSNHRDRGVLDNTSLHKLDVSKQQLEDSEIKDVHEEEVDPSNQSDSEFEEKEEDEQKSK